jgi:hypothetical protein
MPVVSESSIRPGWALAVIVALAASCQVGADARSPLDRPTEQSWPAVNRWNDRMETEYAMFVAALGAAVEARRCHHLDECLRDPRANTTYEPAVDAALRLQLDCADLPYVLRAYFAFKRRLPFAFVSTVAGVGPDLRYALGVVPTSERSWRDFATPRRLLEGVVSSVHSGMYRIAASVGAGDFYPLRIERAAVQPGAIYYDPNGHVLVVARVDRDGLVHLIDGHPDGSLTWKRFGAAFAIGTARLGGGFKAFRPVGWNGSTITRTPDRDLPYLDAEHQYAHRSAGDDGRPYHLWVRASLAATGVAVDPIPDVRAQIAALCRDVAERVDAVQLAVDAGIARAPHPGVLPPNVYGADGDWELYSTPSRDARLKAAFLELRDTVAELPDRLALAQVLRQLWAEQASSPACRFAYRTSVGGTVVLDLDDVLDRLFDLSFDPYHCSELRWGARRGSAELATCGDDAAKRRWYEAEARLRNRIDRDYGAPTPLDAGPSTAPDIDVRRLLGP